MNDMTSLGTGSSVLLSVCGGRFRAVLSLNFPGSYTLYGPGLCEYGRAGDVAAAEAEAVAWLKEQAATVERAKAKRLADEAALSASVWRIMASN